MRLRQRGDWLIPIDAAISHETWEGNSNVAIRFVRECLAEVAGERAETSLLWRAYLGWAGDEGGYRLAKPSFYERLEQVIGLRRTVKGKQYFVGWKLLPPDELHVIDDDDINDD